MVVDIHSGFHGRLQGLARGWCHSPGQAVIEDIGGVKLLAPLFGSFMGVVPIIDLKEANISTRLEMLTAFCSGQPWAQNDMWRCGLVDMLEYALYHVSVEQLSCEDPVRCVAALEGLVAAVAEGSLLFDAIVSRLLFNTRLFAYGAPFKLQFKLICAQRQFVKTNTKAFSQLVITLLNTL